MLTIVRKSTLELFPLIYPYSPGNPELAYYPEVKPLHNGVARAVTERLGFHPFRERADSHP
jgi:hypothetical protein